MHFVSALDDSPGIRPVLGLHETVCTGAADGYGRMTGKPAMTLLHLGPGLANGLANLHNARRARTPLINVVGDMAGWHTGADALLAMDIDALAGTVSADVHRVKSHTQAPALFARARSVRGVTTLIVPHDVAWARELGSATHTASPGEEHQNERAALAEGTREFVRDLASAMKSCRPGKLGIYCGGKALLDEGAWSELAGKSRLTFCLCKIAPIWLPMMRVTCLTHDRGCAVEAGPGGGGHIWDSTL